VRPVAAAMSSRVAKSRRTKAVAHMGLPALGSGHRAALSPPCSRRGPRYSGAPPGAPARAFWRARALPRRRRRLRGKGHARASTQLALSGRGVELVARA